MKVEVLFNESDRNEESNGFRTCTVTSADDNGICIKKTVHCSQLIELLNKSMEDSRKYLHLGEMPRGYLDAKILDLEPLTAEILLFLPESRKRLLYENSFYEIPMPNMLMRIGVLKGRLQNSFIVCLKKCMTMLKVQQCLSEKEDIEWYRYPFGNVSDNGRICWGNNDFQLISRIKNVELFPNLFFDSPSNDDYYHKGRTNLEFLEIRMLYEFLEKKEEFPDEALVFGGTFQW